MQQKFLLFLILFSKSDKTIAYNGSILVKTVYKPQVL